MEYHVNECLYQDFLYLVNLIVTFCWKPCCSARYTDSEEALSLLTANFDLALMRLEGQNRPEAVASFYARCEALSIVKSAISSSIMECM